ncbi:MAG: phytanoyl-CoA dioxygenase family protein [Verrucomicrobia bacterium]|nr:phytanoyl-CoA dioxygenase family protein [Verrucomicrobiota bacterium]MDA1086165.1 phytanoyl-CoA dioxygenase family protein [Verrucomicrobiota bacterium]
MAFTQEQLNDFHRDGYVRLGRVLSDDELETLRENYDLEMDRARETNAYRNLSIDDGTDSDAKQAAPRRMLQITQMCERNIHFRRLLYNKAILEYVTDLIGPNIQLFHDQALFKPAKDGGAVFWHQDNAYWKCRPANLVSCWTTLDDVDVNNGAMQVIPGSHLSPVVHEQSDQTNALLDLQGVDESKAVAIDLPAGGCMFHHCQTLHYTAPNSTERQRRAFIMHFMTPGTRQGDDNGVLEVSFGRPILQSA